MKHCAEYSLKNIEDMVNLYLNNTSLLDDHKDVYRYVIDKNFEFIEQQLNEQKKINTSLQVVVNSLRLEYKYSEEQYMMSKLEYEEIQNIYASIQVSYDNMKEIYGEMIKIKTDNNIGDEDESIFNEANERFKVLEDKIETGERLQHNMLFELKRMENEMNALDTKITEITQNHKFSRLQELEEFYQKAKELIDKINLK